MELIYLALPNIEISRLRVAERVAHGGHEISEQALVRRFPRSLLNLFNHYAPLVTRTRCFLNAGPEPGLIFEQTGSEMLVHDRGLLELLKKEARI